MFVLGITGSLGSGKTTVAAMFKKLGAKVIDADRIGHCLLYRDTPVYKKTLKLLGRGILNYDGSINRAKLAGLVFGDPAKLSAYLKIIHPRIKSQIRRRIKQYGQNGVRFVVLDAPLLIECNMRRDVDKLLVVKRGCARERLAPKVRGKLYCRMGHQLSQSEKIKYADYVIDNRGGIRETERQVKRIWGSCRKIMLQK